VGFEQEKRRPLGDPHCWIAIFISMGKQQFAHLFAIANQADAVAVKLGAMLA
jgi:hypothetical protein